MSKNGGRVGAVITALAVVLGVAVLASTGGDEAAPAQPQAVASDVPGIPNCGGNSETHWVEVVGGWQCANTKEFTVQGVTFVVTAVTQFNHGGSGFVTYTLSRTLPQPVPVRVRAYDGISSGGNLIFDSAQDGPDAIPAGALTYVLAIRHGCGQADIKAVFTAPGDGRGRVSGPFVCDRQVDSTTTTTPGTTPTTQPDGTTTTGPAVSIATVPGRIPDTE